MILERKAKVNLDNIKINVNKFGISEEKTINLLKDTVKMQQLYGGAVREISTKLEILDDEFHVRYSHNPIHHMESRLKQPQSIMEKLKRKGLEVSIESAMKNLNDIAGIRVICYYINDVYTIAKLLIRQSDISLIKMVDYIKEPKSNGYRSLHIVVSVPVFLSSETKIVPVEIQIRTIAMDFWASLEHQLRYKSDSEIKEDLQKDLQKDLQECAEGISNIDLKMQDIYNKLKN